MTYPYNLLFCDYMTADISCCCLQPYKSQIIHSKQFSYRSLHRLQHYAVIKQKTMKQSTAFSSLIEIVTHKYNTIQ